jgi:hypothetical protein
MMLRRLATVVLMVAVTLVGLPPIGVPMADAAMMVDEEHCCPECEQGMPQADRDCAERSECAFSCAPACYLPTSGLVRMQRSLRQVQRFPNDRAVPPEPMAPPLRPPPLSILL